MCGFWDLRATIGCYAVFCRVAGGTLYVFGDVFKEGESNPVVTRSPEALVVPSGRAVTAVVLGATHVAFIAGCSAGRAGLGACGVLSTGLGGGGVGAVSGGLRSPLGKGVFCARGYVNTPEHSP